MRKRSQKERDQKNYINNLWIRYVTCLVCKYVWRIFDPLDLKSQRCCNEYCKSNKTKFKDIKPNYFADEIRCQGKFQCYSCSNEWTSFSTWIFYKQNCFNCNRANHPIECRHIHSNGSYYRSKNSKKKHNTKTCEFCIKKEEICVKLKGNDDIYYPYI